MERKWNRGKHHYYGHHSGRHSGEDVSTGFSRDLQDPRDQWQSSSYRRPRRRGGRHGPYNGGPRRNFGTDNDTGQIMRQSGQKPFARGRECPPTTGGRERPPPGLRGREIGLWYAARSRGRAKTARPTERELVHLDDRRERHLSELLSTIRSSDDSSYSRFANPPPVPDNNAADDIALVSPPSELTRHMTSDNDTLFCVDRTSGDMVSHQVNLSSARLSNNRDDTSDDNDCICVEDVATDAVGCTYVNRFHGDLGGEEDDADDDDDGGEDCDEDLTQPLQIEDLYRCAELGTDYEEVFMTEFLEHRRANTRSYENQKDAEIELERDASLDKQLMADLHRKQSDNVTYHRLRSFREKLPSFQMRQQITELINDNQVVVLSGETGCGKTTQVTQFILDDWISRGDGSLCRIVCTQPRRISAITVAERVAEERGEGCGDGDVGYQIRLEARLPRKQGSILYCTTGILLQWLSSDPWLRNTSHVILDEVHERDLQTDFLMVILKELVVGRPDLKVVLMSATLNADMFSEYFRNCPTLNIPGYTFPVTEFLLEDVIEMTGFSVAPRPPRKRRGERRHEMQERIEALNGWLQQMAGRYSTPTLNTLKVLCDSDELNYELTAVLVEYIITNKPDGAILIFMPGWSDISKVNDLLLRSRVCRGARIIPLHSQMPTVNQKEVFNRPPPGVRKIIIATNIAETSITIDDVVYVIDCGKIKMKNFDASNNIATLQPEWVSVANSRQRRGRAGRVQPGECYHLYTTKQAESFTDYQLPELLRTRLEELCLQIKLLKLGHIEEFVSKAMQPPAVEALRHAIDTLTHLNALDANEDLTPLGYHLARMPVDPHTGKMLLFAAVFACLDPILTVAASLSFKSAFQSPLGKEQLVDARKRLIAGDSRSDHIMLTNAFAEWEKAEKRGQERRYCYDNFLSISTLRMLRNMRGQFTKLLHHMGFLDSSNPKATTANINSANEQVVKAVLCAGLYPNVAKIHKFTKRAIMLHTKTEKVSLHLSSVNEREREFASRWLIYHMKMKTSKIYLYDSTMVSAFPLLFFGGSIDVRGDSLVVDDWIVFRAEPKIAKLVKELRRELDKLLVYKVTHPSQSNWNKTEKEGALLHAIRDLVTMQTPTRARSKHATERASSHTNPGPSCKNSASIGSTLFDGDSTHIDTDSTPFGADSTHLHTDSAHVDRLMQTPSTSIQSDRYY